MKQAIGFATKFYTLWSIDTQPVYTTDSHGKHWLTRYDTKFFYNKNISTSIDKVKSLYPDLEVMEDLRGKTESWVSRSVEDLCPQILKFGKYIGRDINEIIEEDFQYIIWLCDNRGYSSNGKYAMSTPQVQAHFKSIDDDINKLISDRNNAFEAFLQNGYVDILMDKNLRVYDDNAYTNVELFEGMFVTIKFDIGTFSKNSYNGYSYGLPLIKGKGKRIKGKTVRFSFTEDKDEVYQVIVNSVEIINNIVYEKN